MIHVVQARPLYEPVEEIESAESLQYNFDTIKVAADNFSEANKLGRVGFGSVYRVKRWVNITQLVLYLSGSQVLKLNLRKKYYELESIVLNGTYPLYVMYFREDFLMEKR